MLRHWRELEQTAREHPLPDVDIFCPLGAAPPPRPIASRFIRAWYKYFAYPRIAAGLRDVDIVHVLDHSFAHVLRGVPAGVRKIVTVHDLAPLEDHSLTPVQEARFRKTLGWLRVADLLLCDSTYTASRVREFVGAGAPIEVLLMGVNSESFRQERPFPPDLPLPPYPRILSVGSCIPRKNLQVVPAILREVVAQSGPVSLLRVGEPLPPELRAAITQILPAERLVEYGRASDEDLASIYQASDVLVFPSTLEGFGLPLIEAMAAGCAVVSSRSSSLPEVGGEAALYFDARNPDEAAARIIEILEQPALRESLRRRGRERVSDLSWENHWRKTADIYRAARA